MRRARFSGADEIKWPAARHENVEAETNATLLLIGILWTCAQPVGEESLSSPIHGDLWPVYCIGAEKRVEGSLLVFNLFRKFRREMIQLNREETSSVG